MGLQWDLCGGVAEMASKGGAQGRGPSMVGGQGRSPRASHPAPFPSHARQLCGLFRS